MFRAIAVRMFDKFNTEQAIEICGEHKISDAEHEQVEAGRGH